ncbi:MAG: N-acetylmuramic acid 6-phosphate etherase, partial [Boseongicola sp.]|nr:N-acetylmuramic acid 6-phosphate etherase [Boseongicola sp.]
ADRAASVFVEVQIVALQSVQKASKEIARAAEAMASVIRSGGSLVYAAAGSSGLIALADACELPGTFGIPADRVQVHMAGGVPVDVHMSGGSEDDTQAAVAAVRGVAAGDVVIVLSASGTTPYAVAVAECARSKGAVVIGIANNPGSLLLELAEIPVCLATPPEVIAGSTRLGAGTAQKAALNLMSSQMGIDLGHVFQGKMVNVIADNTKLVGRAVGIVSGIADVSEDAAKSALDAAGGNTKLAILVAAGAPVAQADQLLSENAGQLGPCLNYLKSNQNIIA